MAWSGNLLANLTALEAKVKAGALQGVTLAAEHVLGESTKVVPIEEGTLSASGKTDAQMDGDVAVGAVSYDTPYAARQHEEMGWRHDAGRTAKYLERPLGEAGKVVGKIYAEAVKKALS